MGASLGKTLWFLGPYAKIVFGMNYAVWLLHAAPNGSDKFYDLTGAVSFAAAVLLASSRAAAGLSVRAAAVAGAGLLWCSRLGWFLFRRILRDGTDRRQKFKGHPALFLVPFTIQAIWTLCLVTPAALSARFGGAAAQASDSSSSSSSPPPPELSWADAGLAALWAFGFLLEVVADIQKHAFAEAGLRETTGFITTGVWSVSRHPNYMGEILLWVAAAGLAYREISGSVDCPLPGAVFAAPLMTYILLNHVSGIPLLEARARKVWGSRPEFQRYVANTPVLWGNPVALLREMLARA